MAMTGISSRLASRIAMCSIRVSRMNTAPGKATHVADARQVPLQLDDFLLHLSELFLGMALMRRIGEGRLHLFHFVDAASDGLEIGQHAAQPSLVDKKLVGSFGLFLQNLRRLALGADEQDGFTGRHGVAGEGIGLLHARDRLLQDR